MIPDSDKKAPDTEFRIRYVLSKKQMERLEGWHYHADTKDPERFKIINNATRDLAKLIMELTPEGRPQSIALTDLETVRMRANQAIVYEKHDYDEGSGKLATEPKENPAKKN